jgi:hypothetical protein
VVVELPILWRWLCHALLGSTVCGGQCVPAGMESTHAGHVRSHASNPCSTHNRFGGAVRVHTRYVTHPFSSPLPPRCKPRCNPTTSRHQQTAHPLA